MDDAIFEYFDALKRIKEKKPIRVHRDAKITQNLVALEAGRKAGSIKPSRSSFALLIKEIEKAAKEQDKGTDMLKAKLFGQQEEISKIELAIDQSLSRQANLIFAIYKTKLKLNKRTGSPVTPLIEQLLPEQAPKRKVAPAKKSDDMKAKFQKQKTEIKDLSHNLGVAKIREATYAKYLFELVEQLQKLTFVKTS